MPLQALLYFIIYFYINSFNFCTNFYFIFAPGFYFDPVKQEISGKVLRIMFPYLGIDFFSCFCGWNSKYSSKIFNSSFTPVIFNLSTHCLQHIVAPKYEMPIYVLAWGVLLAGFVQLLIQIAPLRSINRLPHQN
jgi:putative peptidoglycan lipid II flippase